MLSPAKPHAVVVPGDSDPAILNAGARTSEVLGLELQLSESPDENALSAGPVSFLTSLDEVAAVVGNGVPDGNWHAVISTGTDGWAVTGATPRCVASALLGLADDILLGNVPARPCRKVCVPVFDYFGLDFDDWSFGFSRDADGFNLETHVRDLVRVGVENLDINILADLVPIQVRERLAWRDKYQWWCAYAPALDMFVESSLNRGTYPSDVLSRNLENMRRVADTARNWGLKTTFVAFEPRAWPERLFYRWPGLRGARVDNSVYSAEAEFAPDVGHPQVLEHYAELMANLMSEVPDLDFFQVWAQDSCAGFPWADMLYPGPNGPLRARKQPVEKTVVEFLTVLRDAGRKVNPDLRIGYCGTWFTDPEVKKTIPLLPEGVDVTITAGPKSDLPQTGEFGWERVELVRKKGRDPIVQVEGISNFWKAFTPVLGVPFPYLCCDMLRDMLESGKVRRAHLRGGITSAAFVPNYINNEVIRAFLFEGVGLDVEELVRRKAELWTSGEAEAEALLRAWKLADKAVREWKSPSWTVTNIFGRVLARLMVRPVVPDPSRLTAQETAYFRPIEFRVGQDDPAWVDAFYFGWSRVVADDVAAEYVARFSEKVLPPLQEAAEGLLSLGDPSETVADVRDRLFTLAHVVRTDRNLMASQEAIHAAIAAASDGASADGHLRRIREAATDEIENVERFADLLDSSSAALIPQTSGEDTVYLYRAPLSHQLRLKVKVMRDHVDDAPGPRHRYLDQPGGWTSDLELPRA